MFWKFLRKHIYIYIYYIVFLELYCFLETTIPARPARPIAPVVHLMMLVHHFMIEEPKTWNSEMLEKYVHPDDILLIQSLAISQGYQRDKYCWNYTKNVMYTVKSGYWVATNILNREPMEYIKSRASQNSKLLLEKYKLHQS